MDGLFNLNDKADAAEAFNNILAILHATTCRYKGQIGDQINLDEFCDPMCLIHDTFAIRSSTLEKCECGKQFPQPPSSPNNFTQIIIVAQLIDNLTSQTLRYTSTKSYVDLEKIQDSFIHQVKLSLVRFKILTINRSKVMKFVLIGNANRKELRL